MRRKTAFIKLGKSVFTPRVLFVLSSLAAIWLGVQDAYPRTLAVTSTADNGPGSLRTALALAADGDTINVVAHGTIVLTTGELIVDKSVTIRGPGRSNLGVSGNGTSRVFHITPDRVVTIDGLTITNGRATGGFLASAGGAIFSDHATLTVSNCIIRSNSARFGGGIFSNSFGGGSATLTVNNSTVSNNTSRLGYGGGIFSGGGFLSTGPSGDATLTLNNTTVSSNSAGFGGGIFNDGFYGNATATIAGGSINNNSVKFNGFVAGGGGIYNNGDSGVAIVRLSHSTVNENVAGLYVEDPAVEHPYEPGRGGGIYNDGTASIAPGNAQMILDNTTVNHNIAQSEFPESRGGGIYNDGSSGSALVSANNCSINENTSVEGGAGIYSIAFSGEVTTTLTGCAVNRNASTSFNSGGGIDSLAFRSDPNTPSNANLTLVNTIVRENSRDAIISGGGDAGTGTLQVTNCDISGNFGYGIVNSSSVSSTDSSAAISQSVVSENTGGGILNSCFSATISDSVISRNRADDSPGGGIANIPNVGGSSNLRVTNTTITDNSSAAGGGIANICSSESFATLIMEGSTLSGNHAATGGGLLNDGSQGVATATVTNSSFSGNLAVGQLPPDWGFSGHYEGGGGLLNGYETGGFATLNLTNCTVSTNSTSKTGGGIGNHGRDVGSSRGVARLILNDSTLSGNSAAEGGDSILNDMNIEASSTPPPCPGCPPPLPNGRATADLTNTILNVDVSRENIRNLSIGAITSHGYNLSSDAAGGDGSSGPGGFLNAIGDIRNTDPLLGPLDDNGGPTWTHALLLGSPAIDAGDPNFNANLFTPPLLFDQRGLTFARVVNGRIDIGAFESMQP
jgi:hypothetical protein